MNTNNAPETKAPNQTKKEHLSPTQTTRRTLNSTTARNTALSRLTVGRQREERKGKGPHDEINARGLTAAASASADIKAWAAIVDWSDDD